MLKIRRLYFYLVSYVSLVMVMTGLATLGRVLIEQALGLGSSGMLFGAFAGRNQFREQSAFGIALISVGLPVWLIHWRLIENWLRGDQRDEERRSALRRLYLYLMLLTTMLVVYSSARDLLQALLSLVLRAANGADGLAAATRPLPSLAIALLFWSYHWQLAGRDRVMVGETGASATLRRWYLYGISAVGVVPLMANLAELFQRLWSSLVRPSSIGAFGSSLSVGGVAENSATVLVGLAVWLLHRRWGEEAGAASAWHGENERHSVLRKVYLYAIVTLTVAWALINAGQILRVLLLAAMGVPLTEVDGEPMLVALGRPLSNIVVFGLFWLYYWRAVVREGASESEVGRQASVRRVYFYLVSAVSLAILAIGLAGLLRMLADLLVGAAIVNEAARRGEIATHLCAVLVALPVWLVHWAGAQRLTRGDYAEAELRATSRRWYLYLIVLAAVIVLLVSGAWLVYNCVRVVLGLPLDRDLMAQTAHVAANATVAGVLLWYHWWLVLRSEVAALRQWRAGGTAVAVVSGLDSSAVGALEAFVKERLEGARVRIQWSDEGGT